ELIHSPTSVPAAVDFLAPPQKLDRFRQRGPIRFIAELCDHAHATRRHVGRRRIQQRSVVGKWYVIQVFVGAVDIESAPATICALQTQDPFTPAADGLDEFSSVTNPGTE